MRTAPTLCQPLCLFLFLGFILISSPALAFDCFKIDWGAPMSEIDDGNFVPYMTKGDVTYYNYTGACRLPAHDYANTAVAYAFVDGRIYARIVRGWGDDVDTVLARIEGGLGPYTKIAEDEDWVIYSWDVHEHKKVKLKYNPTSTEIKTATYYEPLREVLQERESHDPAD